MAHRSPGDVPVTVSATPSAGSFSSFQEAPFRCHSRWSRSQSPHSPCLVVTTELSPSKGRTAEAAFFTGWGSVSQAGGAAAFAGEAARATPATAAVSSTEAARRRREVAMIMCPPLSFVQHPGSTPYVNSCAPARRRRITPAPGGAGPRPGFRRIHARDRTSSQLSPRWSRGDANGGRAKPSPRTDGNISLRAPGTWGIDGGLFHSAPIGPTAYQ